MAGQLRLAHQDKLKVETAYNEQLARVAQNQDWQTKYEQLVEKTIKLQAAAATIASHHSVMIQSHERQRNILEGKIM